MMECNLNQFHWKAFKGSYREGKSMSNFSVLVIEKLQGTLKVHTAILFTCQTQFQVWIQRKSRLQLRLVPLIWAKVWPCLSKARLTPVGYGCLLWFKTRTVSDPYLNNSGGGEALSEEGGGWAVCQGGQGLGGNHLLQHRHQLLLDIIHGSHFTHFTFCGFFVNAIE